MKFRFSEQFKGMDVESEALAFHYLLGWLSGWAEHMSEQDQKHLQEGIDNAVGVAQKNEDILAKI